MIRAHLASWIAGSATVAGLVLLSGCEPAVLAPLQNTEPVAVSPGPCTAYDVSVSLGLAQDTASASAPSPKTGCSTALAEIGGLLPGSTRNSFEAQADGRTESLIFGASPFWADTDTCEVSVSAVPPDGNFDCEISKTQSIGAMASKGTGPGSLVVMAAIQRAGGGSRDVVSATVSLQCSGSGSILDLEVDLAGACLGDSACRATGLIETDSAGDTCTIDRQLQVSSTITRDTLYSLTVSVAKPRQSCETNADCGNLKAPFCHEGLCQAGALRDPCFHDAQCAARLMCTTDGCGTGEEGSHCAVEADCDDGLLCGAFASCVAPPECDPLERNSCDGKQARCTWVRTGSLGGGSRGGSTRTACAPAGTLAEGAICTLNPFWETGPGDDCEAGLTCHGGVCGRLCADSGDCSGDQLCQRRLAPAMFQDVIAVTGTSIGVCKDPDPVVPAGLTGFVDFHTHPMAHLGFGGNLIHGAPDVGSLMPLGTIEDGAGCNSETVAVTSMADALGNCSATHGGWDLLNNTCGNIARHEVIKQMEDEKGAHGVDIEAYPSFANWPNHEDLSHQKMWVDWIERAHDEGLSVMVALALNSFTLAQGVAGNWHHMDRASADVQIQEMHAFAERHDFMEVAFSPEDLRRIVDEGKLAVVIGVEIDDIGDFNFLHRANPSFPNDSMIRGEIQRLHDMGVRYIFPVHVIDNVFGGTALYEDTFSLANRYHWGRWWDVDCADAIVNPDIGWRQDPLLGFLTAMFDAIGNNALFPEALFVSAQSCPAGAGHQNRRGLQRRGYVALRQMMSLGMLIDIDHSSRRTVTNILDLMEESGGYPVISGHNGPTRSAVDSNENERTPEHYARIAASGGMIGLGTAYTASEFKDVVADLRASYPDVGIGLGSDINGVVASPGAPCLTNEEKEECAAGNPPVVYDESYPMMSMDVDLGGSQILTRSWDYNKEGVAHYGLLPDYLRDVESKGGAAESQILHEGAEAFARTWERAESLKDGVTVEQGLLELGGSCDSSADCQSKLCDVGPIAPESHTCVPIFGTGVEGDHCTRIEHCQGGLVCRAVTNVAGECRP